MRKIILTSLLFFSIASRASALPISWPDNGHYYDLIPFSSAPLSWQEALTDAESLTYLGVNGHLATITSAGENAFLNTTFNGGQDSQFAWLGGYEPNDDGVWKWATGPEAGIQFANGVTPTSPFNYANWGGIEPNDRQSMEDFLMFNIGKSFRGIDPGEWADAQPNSSGDDPVVAYFVEYETAHAVPEPSTMLLLSFGLLGAIRFKKVTRFVERVREINS